MRNVIAVDIGGSKISCGIVDEAGRILYKDFTPLHEIRIDRILKIIEKAYSNFPKVETESVGVNIPGLADPKNGVWVFAPYSGITNFPIERELQPLFRKPIRVDNDVNACAIAEKRFGCCKDTEDFLWMTVSNGIGGAVYLNNELYRGKHLLSGEIGHFVMEENGPPCGCGNRGCLEAVASGPAIARLYCRLSGIPVCETMRSREVGKLAKRGDANALKSFETAGNYLGKAISYAVNLLNIDRVVLGGGVLMDESLIMPSIKSSFEKNIFRRANTSVLIRKTQLGYDAALLGAAAVALSNR